MMSGVEARLDGSTLIVHIPMRFQRRGGRKRIVAPDGSVVAPNAKPAPDGTLLKALARAWRWQRMLDDGVYTTVSEIGDTENISKSYVSRILRLALLAPDIAETILSGRTDQALMLEQLVHRRIRPIHPAIGAPNRVAQASSDGRIGSGETRVNLLNAPVH